MNRESEFISPAAERARKLENMTDADFDQAMEEVLARMTASQVANLTGDINMLVREELNNEVLDHWLKGSKNAKLQSKMGD